MKNRVAGLLCGLALCMLAGGVLMADDASFPNNIVRNGGFDAAATDAPSIPGVPGTSYWIFSLNGGGAGGKAVASMENGALKVGAYTDKGSQIYAVQVIQSPVTVVKGTRYHLQFDAKAEAARSIKVKVGGTEGRGWVDYTHGTGDGTEFKLTTQMKTYTLDFDMSDATDKAARVEFQLGLNTSAVWIDNVVLSPDLAAGELVRDGSLKNGDFAKDYSYWDTWASSADWSGVGEAKLSVKSGELAVNVSSVGSVAYNPQIRQTGLVFERGKSYQVSFKARSDKSRAIQINIGQELKADPFYRAFASTQVFQLGAAMQPYSFSFTMREATPVDGSGKLVFEFGAIDGQKVASTVTISNVAVVELDKPVVHITPLARQEQVKNGNFEIDTAGWKTSGTSALSVDKGALKVLVAAKGETLSQAGLKIEKGEPYVLSFVANAGTASKLGVSLAAEDGTQYLPAKTREAAIGEKESYVQYYFESPVFDSTVTLSFDTAALAADSAKAGKTATLWLDRVSLRKTGRWMDPSLPVAERVKLLMDAMDIDDKAAQMVQSERSAVKEGEISSYGIGSVLSGGGSVPAQNTPEGWIAMFNAFQEEAVAGPLGIPLIYGIDAVHGHGNVYGATIFPHNIGLGAARDAALIEKIGGVVAEEVAATGLNWTFGPAVSVSRDERWGRVYESFGESPELQKLLAGPFIRGLQGKIGAADWLKGAHIVATAKHFLGDGGAEWKTGEGQYTIDRGDIKTLSLDQLKTIHAQGYVQAIAEGVQTVMASFNLFKGQHMHANKALLTDYLKAPKNKGGLGFEGFVIGDWDAVSLLREVGGDYEKKIVTAFNAGLDMSMEQSQWKKVIETLVAAAGDKRVTQSRIDDAVRRILTVKFNAGLFDKPWALRSYTDSFGSAEHRAVAAQAVRESLVLLKNEKDVLPLKPNAKVFVTGPLADNVGWQSGGWTIQWQGGGDQGSKRLIPGTSILDGFAASAKSGGGEIITDPDRAKEASVAVVVVGEMPYAEGVGDIPGYGDMRLDGNSSKLASGNMEAITQALALKIPVVVVMVSGRPLVVTDELPRWSAFVAAWLPGSEGGAIADVLYGKENFTGTLPLTWPRSIEQLPINVGDADYAKKGPLFPYGFGLKMKLPAK